MYEFGPIKERVAKAQNADETASRRRNRFEEKGVVHLFSHRFYQGFDSENEQRSRLSEDSNTCHQRAPADD